MRIRRPYVIVFACVVALGAVDALAGYVRRTYPRGAFTREPRAVSEPQFFARPLALRPFSATDIDGRVVSASTWRGKVAVVNFWATWCLPCRNEIPALVALQEKFKADALVIGILDDTASIDFVRAFANTLHINYPIVRLTPEIELSFSQTLVLPTTFVVDPAGRVVAMHAGEIDPALLEREVQAIVGAAD
jgi:thiol-disulfide isomerase/thioredoxin